MTISTGSGCPLLIFQNNRTVADILKQGHEKWALTDLTGGVAGGFGLTWERINQIGVDNFKNWIRKYLADDGLFCTANAIEPGTHQTEFNQSNGLVKGHAYSLLYLEDIETSNGNVTLMRIRNPWGHHEWNGAWSDSSAEWDTVSDEVKERVKIRLFPV